MTLVETMIRDAGVAKGARELTSAAEEHIHRHLMGGVPIKNLMIEAQGQRDRIAIEQAELAALELAIHLLTKTENQT